MQHLLVLLLLLPRSIEHYSNKSIKNPFSNLPADPISFSAVWD
jgi:hypothetical protein